MRVAVLGMGIIGKRLVDAVQRQPDMSLAGVAVRSASAAVIAQPGLSYFVTEPAGTDRLRTAGVRVAGTLTDLLAGTDVLVDAGPARSGATRAATYRAAGVTAVFCGGERDPRLGPLVHPALNHLAATGRAGVRMTSCNTTALARLVAAVGPAAVASLTATVVRCATDNDKAAKGVVNSAVFDARPSHHASDLTALAPGLPADSYALTVPMLCGHVILVRLRLRPTTTADEVIGRLGQVPRIVVLPAGRHDTATLRSTLGGGAGRRWSDRYELAVQPDPLSDTELVAWLSLDNEAITVPEAMDVVRACGGQRDASAVHARTNHSLGIPSPRRFSNPIDARQESTNA